MKKQYLLFILLGLLACNSSELSKDFDCGFGTFSNLEEITDFKKNFKVELPKHWKTNLFYNELISSIYTADTTLNLTQTTIMDISFVLNPIDIDEDFISKIETDNKKMNLQAVKSKKITFLDKPSYYNLSKGKKGKYSYQILNVFTKSATGFLHIKTEVYGDSLPSERICKAIKLIEKIELN